jgi:hypothetical protein
VPLGTRCHRIVRQADGWLVWIATRDYQYGTYLLLHNDGRVYRVVVRENEGDEIIVVRPSDADTCNQGEQDG